MASIQANPKLNCEMLANDQLQNETKSSMIPLCRIEFDFYEHL